MKITKGQKFHEQAHYKLINRLFNKNYTFYRSCVYSIHGANYSPIAAWFIRLWSAKAKDIVGEQGWENRKIDAFTITEDFIGNEQERLDSHKKMPNDNDLRAIFNIIEIGRIRTYVFEGVYRYVANESNYNHRHWFLIDDSLNI